ncbi:hypothetical protein BGZ93_007190 [Podila epicladia]|nr:hypothetical protein BGZ92_001043 [Podila epicladia]KAG0094470.1 hypothetical protein BGZ93_007190 [Podila epicladia]
MDHPPSYTQSNNNSAHGSPLIAPSPVQGATPGTPGTPRTPGTPGVPELILPPVLPLQPHGSTPAPSDDHPDMVSHPSQILLEDEDDQAYEDRQRASRGRARYHHSHSQGGSPFSSRPNSPSPPPPLTTASTLLNNHALANSVSASPSSYSAEASSTSALQHALSFFGHHSTHSTPSSIHSSPSASTTGNSHAHTHTDQYPSSASSSKTLRIELSNPEVVLQTGQSTRMEGILYVNLHKPTKVKTLTLEFSGRSSVTWVDDNAYSPATRHTTAPHIEHTWALIPHQHKQPPTVLPAGQHTYPFVLDLPHTLPETLTTTHGKVAYRLTATLTKPGLTFHSSTVTLPVPILRKHPTQPARSFQRGGRAVSAPEDKIRYKISLPQIRVPHSTKIPLQVSITTPNPRTSVTVLQVGLWERVVYRADGRKRVDMRLVKIQKSEGWPHEDRHGQPSNESVTWNKVLLFDMPPMGSELHHCNPSADNGLMKVTHLLRFSILGTDGLKRFRVENEIDMKVLAFEDEYFPEEGEDPDADPTNELPSYLTSFTTPRVSFDSERDMDPVDDDLLRGLLARIHLPTYAESEEDANSRNPSRDVSRDVSRNPSRAQSRSTSPERPASAGSIPHHQHHQLGYHLQQPHYHHHHHHHHHGSPLGSMPSSPLATASVVPGDDDGHDADVSAATSPVLAPAALPRPNSGSRSSSQTS